MVQALSKCCAQSKRCAVQALCAVEDLRGRRKRPRSSRAGTMRSTPRARDADAATPDAATRDALRAIQRAFIAP